MLPDGMSYRVLVLPEIRHDDAGAAAARSRNWSRPARRVIGPPPLQVAEPVAAIRSATPKCKISSPNSGAKGCEKGCGASATEA